MPELPEVEMTKRGLSPYLLHQRIERLELRQLSFRVLISAEDSQRCVGQQVRAISRRAKYLLLELSQGHILIHLGMSGHLRIANATQCLRKHDHIDLILSNGTILRYNDPRRFGLWLYNEEPFDESPWLSRLGPEPLSQDFDGNYLYAQAEKKKQPIKSFIMKNEVVVGVGNIYASESLFLAGIHPLSPAGSIERKKLVKLAHIIKQVLQQAIDAGGTSLRDFYQTDGKPGYFSHHLQVYGRKNLPCFHCNSLIQLLRIGGRSSTFCPNCQLK